SRSGAAAVAPSAMGPAALSPRRHPRQGRSRDDGAFARGALPAPRSPRRRARRPAAVVAPRQRGRDQAAVQAARRAVAAGRDVVAPEDGIRRAAPAMVRRRADPVGARHPARSPHARARLDRRRRSGASAPPARARRARSRETHLGARLSGAMGARARGPRRKTRAGMRVTMLVRCLAMMRGGGETRHLAWARELTSLGVDVDIIAGRPLLFGGPRYPHEAGLRVTLLRSPYT